MPLPWEASWGVEGSEAISRLCFMSEACPPILSAAATFTSNSFSSNNSVDLSSIAASGSDISETVPIQLCVSTPLALTCTALPSSAPNPVLLNFMPGDTTALPGLAGCPVSGPPSPPTADAINGAAGMSAAAGDSQDDVTDANKVRKGQGYRRLWQMVTKVQRGQQLGDGAFDWRDCTVEDLLKIVQQLPANASTVSAVGPGLVYLDSRAVAAFLKALAKTGHGARAVELFDYLRALEEGHELRSLCDVFTYTTMISQCGSHHQLRRALELVGEMRSRAIPLNVHTYSALLNVCLKANELDLALDIYTQMLSEGCTPNMVTYNTLLDIYGKIGKWADALGVLDLLQQQGITPETRTCNTIINACNLSHRYAEAIQVYERMLSMNLKPNASTYVALLTAFARTKQLDAALAIFRSMANNGFERGTNCFAMVLSACEAGGHWEVAMWLLDQMRLEGVRPSTACMNSAITTCLKGGQALVAERLYSEMQSSCKPDVCSFATMVPVYSQLGKFREAINLAEVLLQAGHSMDAAGFDALINVAWGSGVLPLQRYAVQLLQRARGLCGLYNVTVSEQVLGTDKALLVSVPHAPANVQLLMTLEAFKGLRDNPVQANALRCHQLVQARLSVKAAEAAAVDQVVGGLLRTLGCPLTGPVAAAAAAPSDAALGLQDLMYAATADGVAQWLHSSSAMVALGHTWSHFDVPSRPDGLQVISEDALRESRCLQAAAAAQTAAAQHPVIPGTMPAAYLLQRPELVQLLLRSAPVLGLLRDYGHDAVALLDRVMCSAGGAASPTNLMAAACLAICAPPASRDVAAISQLMQVQPGALLVAMGQVQLFLQGDCTAVSAMRVLRVLLERLGHDSKEDAACTRYVAGQALSIIGRAVSSPAFLGCPAPAVAMAVLYACRLAAGVSPAWPFPLSTLLGMPCPSQLLQPYIQAALQLVIEL